ncbi:protein UBASH3A homolog isoform X2 [Pomacea canaliculata]|uniref:protein UBASH3A homolog isoform X2 n=1 Tax=Pomacea canaliculata TaxID=400727 RepID=UPI000D72C3BD|nr:protein UBASH3A homolog isoform X2 [Pomacea canaliculata]
MSVKALAATGDRGVQLALDWLLSHVNDPTLDQDIPREYILYLCPVGKLQEGLATFWEKSLATFGWNSAHNFFPHMTLCSFFKVEDKKLSALEHCLAALKDDLQKAPGKLQLDLFSQKGFIGLMVAGLYDNFLEGIVSKFAGLVKAEGIVNNGPKKQLHITLAHQHASEHHPRLEKLAHEIDLNADVRWDLRLYSRDPRLATSEVRKVVKAYSPDQDDELELIEGDYLFLTPGQNSPDGWYTGTSWLTGGTGVFPYIFTQRTSETWLWALHRSLPVSEEAVATNGVASGGDGDYDNIWQSDELYAKVYRKKKSQDNTGSPIIASAPPLKQMEVIEKKPLSILVMRHGERCDFTFARGWCEKCFDSKGNYTRYNLNLPRRMVPRKSFKEFEQDAPLTEIGRCEARLTGEALRDSGVTISYVYASPALRCVQTAQEVLRGAGYTCQLCIEPTVFEWCGWYKAGLPPWMPPEQLAAAGFSVNTSYVPFIAARNLNLAENVEEYYNRCTSFSRHVARKHESEGGGVLIVGHAGSLDACLRQLCGKNARTNNEFREILNQFPYCCLAVALQDPNSKRWALTEPPVSPLTHTQNKLFNWKILQ